MRATRAELVEAALEEFAAHGLDASLDRICAAAGLTRGAFYVHFADREALIAAAMSQVLGGFVTLITQLRAAPGGTERAIELFMAAARARAPAVHGGRGLRFFHLMDACHRSRSLGTTYRSVVLDGRARLAANIDLDREAGRIRDDLAPDAVADLLVVLALGVVAALELEIPIDLQRLGPTLVASLRSARRTNVR